MLLHQERCDLRDEGGETSGKGDDEELTATGRCTDVIREQRMAALFCWTNVGRAKDRETRDTQKYNMLCQAEEAVAAVVGSALVSARSTALGFTVSAM